MKPVSILIVCVAALFMLSSIGCQAGRGFGQQPYGQFGQVNAPIQQPGFTPSPIQRPQFSLGQIGQDLGRRIGNGFLNRGINQVVNMAF